MIGLYKQNNNFVHALRLFNISKPSLHDCDMKLRNLISGARPLYEYVKTTRFSFSFSHFKYVSFGPTLDKLNEIEQDRFLKPSTNDFLSDAFGLLSFCYRRIVTVT